MWLLTSFGFFSVVQKPDDGPADTLTVRSRVKSDLEALREKYLPSMGPIAAHAGTDYKYRAKASREALAVAMVQIVLDLDYNNFKNSVAMTQGHKRAGIYHKVWEALWALQDEEKQTPAPATISKVSPATAKHRSCGGVLFDAEGRVLLRKPAGEFDGYVWTFAKGRLKSGSTPEQSALHEVQEETGYGAEIIVKIPGSFVGGTSVTEYFLMTPVGEPQAFDPNETEEVRWFSLDEAADHIKLTRNTVGRNRDLAILQAAVETRGAQR